MTDKDTIEMIEQCIAEIESLRRANAELAPKAHAYDAITQILGLLPGESQGYAPDIVWRLRKQIDELQPKVEEQA